MGLVWGNPVEKLLITCGMLLWRAIARARRSKWLTDADREVLLIMVSFVLGLFLGVVLANISVFVLVLLWKRVFGAL